MTITSTPSEISYAGDGVSTIFPIPFVFDTSADLKVIRTDSSGNPVVLSSGLSIGGGAGATGTCTLTTALAAGYTLTILDNPDRTQVADYTDNDAFPAGTHEGALDRGVRISKRIYQLLQKCLRVDDGDPSAGAGTLLGSVQARKGKYLFFNAVTGAIEYAVALATTVLSQSIIAQLLNPQTPAEASAGVTPVNNVYLEGHAFRYMTDAQRASVIARDLTQNVTAALNAAFSLVGVKVFLPSGSYSIQSALAIPVCSEIAGAGFFKTILVWATGVTQPLSITGATTCNVLRDFRIQGNATTNARGLAFGDGVLTSNCRADNIWVTGFTGTGAINVDIRDMVTLILVNPFFESGKTNVRMRQSAVAGCPTTIHLHGGSIRTAAIYGVLIQSGTGIGIHGTVIEANTQEGLFVQPDVGFTVGQVTLDEDVWFEGNYGNDPTKWQMTVDSTVANAKAQVTLQSANFQGLVGSANAVQAVGTFAELNVMEDVSVPNMGGAQPGTITYSGGAFGYVKLRELLIASYATIVTDTGNTAINVYDAYIPWTAYPPTYSSSVGNAATSFSGAVTTTLARFKKFGRIAHVEINFVATLNAVTPTSLSVTVPPVITPQSSNVLTPSLITNAGTNEIGVVRTQTGGTLLIQRLNAANYTISSVVGGSVSLVFEC
jgi:hypothetical protein